MKQKRKLPTDDVQTPLSSGETYPRGKVCQKMGKVSS